MKPIDHFHYIKIQLWFELLDSWISGAHSWVEVRFNVCFWPFEPLMFKLFNIEFDWVHRFKQLHLLSYESPSWALQVQLVLKKRTCSDEIWKLFFGTVTIFYKTLESLSLILKRNMLKYTCNTRGVNICFNLRVFGSRVIDTACVQAFLPSTFGFNTDKKPDFCITGVAKFLEHPQL